MCDCEDRVHPGVECSSDKCHCHDGDGDQFKDNEEGKQL